MRLSLYPHHAQPLQLGHYRGPRLFQEGLSRICFSSGTMFLLLTSVLFLGGYVPASHAATTCDLTLPPAEVKKCLDSGQSQIPDPSDLIIPIPQDPPPKYYNPIFKFTVNPRARCGEEDVVCLDNRSRAETQLSWVIQDESDGGRTARSLLEEDVIQTALPAYGYDLDDYNRFVLVERDRARSLLFTALVGLTEKASRSSDEQEALDWLLERIQAKRVQAAHYARDTYNTWESNPCQYSAPEGLDYSRDHKCYSRYAGLMTSIRPPTFEALQRYGLLEAYTLDPETQHFMERIAVTVKETVNELGLTTSELGLATVGAAYLAGTFIPPVLAALTSASTVASNLIAGAGFSGPIFAVVVSGAVIGINEYVKVVGYEQLPKKLNGAVALAEKPLQPSLLSTEEGMQEAFIAFMEATQLTPDLQKHYDVVVAKLADDPFLYRDSTFDEFNSRWKLLHSRGYRLTDIETYLDSDGKRKWDGVFHPGTGAYALYRSMTTTELLIKHEQYRRSGSHELIDIETYTSGGSRKWVGVWGPGPGGHRLRDIVLHSNYDVFTTRELTNRKNGFKLMDVETYLDSNGQRFFAGFWVKGEGSKKLIRNKTRAQFDSYRQQFAHLKLTDVETYMHDGVQNWIAVWTEEPVGEQDFVEKSVPTFNSGWISGQGVLDYDRFDIGTGAKVNALWAEVGGDL